MLEWIIERCAGRADAVATPIGNLPAAAAINTSGLNMKPQDMAELLHVDIAGWQKELDAIGVYFDEFGTRLPAALRGEQQRIAKALSG